MIDIHCKQCGRFIGKADSKAFLNCPRCKAWNTYVVDTGRVRELPLRRTRVSQPA